MFYHIKLGQAFGRPGFSLILLISSVFTFTASAAASSDSQEVALEYKAKRTGQLELAAYEGELLDCSALAAIHMWIGDGLGDDSGAEVRKKLNSDYWIDLSKGYLALAEQAGGVQDLSEALGVRMRALSAEFRDLTESQPGPDNWTAWYDLVDRCDTWRPERPAHAFYNNGRKSTAIAVKAAEVAMGSR
jgi:hypothetical protein